MLWKAARGIGRGREAFFVTFPHSSLSNITRTLEYQPKNWRRKQGLQRMCSHAKLIKILWLPCNSVALLWLRTTKTKYNVNIPADCCYQMGVYRISIAIAICSLRYIINIPIHFSPYDTLQWLYLMYVLFDWALHCVQCSSTGRIKIQTAKLTEEKWWPFSNYFNS